MKQLKKLRELKLNVKKKNINEYIVDYTIYYNEKMIARCVTKDMNDSNKFQCFCSCGVPQSFNIDCSHMMFIRKDWKHTKEEMFGSLDNETITDEEYKEFYESLEMNQPIFSKYMQCYDEFVMSDTKKKSEKMNFVQFGERKETIEMSNSLV